MFVIYLKKKVNLQIHDFKDISVKSVFFFLFKGEKIKITLRLEVT